MDGFAPVRAGMAVIREDQARILNERRELCPKVLNVRLAANSKPV